MPSEEIDIKVVKGLLNDIDGMNWFARVAVMRHAESTMILDLIDEMHSKTQKALEMLRGDIDD